MGESERFTAAISDCMAGAGAHLLEIRQAMDQLGAAGMWPSVPTEDWSDLKGLYMLFRSNRDGTYKGPDGKREVYIGKDPAAIAEARRLAENRRRWEACELAAWNLHKWIGGKWVELRDLAEDCKRWPALDLGPMAPAAVVTPVSTLPEVEKRK